MTTVTNDNPHALVPVSPARSHATTDSRRQDVVRRTYGNTQTSADTSAFSARALRLAAGSAEPAAETPASRAAVRASYCERPQPQAFVPPGSFINIRV